MQANSSQETPPSQDQTPPNPQPTLSSIPESPSELANGFLKGQQRVDEATCRLGLWSWVRQMRISHSEAAVLAALDSEIELIREYLKA